MGKRTNTAVWMEKYNRWQIKVQKDGERKTFTSSTTGRTGQREANAKADAWLDDNISDGSTRVESLADDYVEELKLRTSKSHWRCEESRMRIWIKPRIGHIKIERINEQHCQDVLNAAYAEGLRKKSLENLKSTFTTFFKYCRKRKVTTFNPENLTIPKGAISKERHILQPKDVIILFSSDSTTFRGKTVRDEYINAYRFIVLTGLRPGELKGLMVNDVDGCILHVKRSINIFNEITTGKNSNAIRSQKMNALAQAVWDDQVNSTDAIYPFGGLTEKAYLKRWTRYCEANGIAPTTLYELRHTFVSMVQSLPEAYVKALVGHSKSMDTFGVYGHELDGMQNDMAQAVESVFRNILNPPKKQSGL